MNFVDIKNTKQLDIVIIFSSLLRFLDIGFMTVLPIHFLYLSNSSALSGLLYSIVFFPGLFLIPLIGSQVEKHNVKKQGNIIMLLSGLIYLILLFSENLSYLGKVNMGLLILINIVFSTENLIAKLIYINMADPNELYKNNGKKSIFENLALMLSPIVYLSIYRYYSSTGVIILCLILSLILFFMSLAIEASPEIKEDKKEEGLKSIVQGLAYVKNDKVIFSIFIMAMSLNFFLSGNEEIIYPGIFISEFGAKESWIGLGMALSSIGSIYMGYALYKNTSSQFSLEKDIYRYMGWNSLVMLLIGAFSLLLFPQFILYFLVFCILQFFIGVFTTKINVTLETFFQKRVEEEYRARFFSLLTFFSRISIPLGIVYSGLLTEFLGGSMAIILNNIVIFLLILFFSGIPIKRIG